VDGRTFNCCIGQSENDKTALPNGITIVYIFYKKQCSSIFINISFHWELYLLLDAGIISIEFMQCNVCRME
jgi:hypothetical protein